MLTDYLGSSSRIKILEFLINNKERSFCIREILLGASVKHRNLVDTLKDLMAKDMVFIDKKVGKSILYQINELQPYVQSLIYANGLSRKLLVAPKSN